MLLMKPYMAESATKVPRQIGFNSSGGLAEGVIHHILSAHRARDGGLRFADPPYELEDEVVAAESETARDVRLRANGLG